MNTLAFIFKKFTKFSIQAVEQLRYKNSEQLATYLKLIANKRYNEAFIYFQRNQTVLGIEVGKIWIDPIEIEIWNKRK